MEYKKKEGNKGYTGINQRKAEINTLPWNCKQYLPLVIMNNRFVFYFSR
jgi:hypothetical protein